MPFSFSAAKLHALCGSIVLLILLATPPAHATVTFNVSTAPTQICAAQFSNLVGAVSLTVDAVGAGTIVSGTRIHLSYGFGTAVNPGFQVSGVGAGVIQATNPGGVLELNFTADQSYSPGDQLVISNVPVVSGGGFPAGQGVNVTLTSSPSTAAAFSPVTQLVAVAYQCMLSVVSGNNQTATVGSVLPSPLVVAMTPCVPGITVNFTVTGVGSVSPAQDTTSAFPNCQASTTFTLGTRSGTNTVTASSSATNTVSFTATATPGPAAAIAIWGGNNQTGPVGGVVIEPLVVRISDQFGNAAPGTLVSFAVTAGGGTVTPTESFTNVLGLASAHLTLGPEPGINTVTAASAGLAGSPLTFTATAIDSEPTPSITSNGVVNGASFRPSSEPNSELAPGAVVTISGSELATATAFATTLPLPTTLGETSVTFNDLESPLFFVSPEQILAQLPFPASSGEASVVVSRGTKSSTPQTVQLAAVSPGIYTVDGSGTGPGMIATAGTFQLVREDNPIHPGEVITIYCNGLGALTPAVDAGTPAPDPPPETVGTPQVTIADIPAEVSFSGLAAGFVGIYRLDAIVPAGVPTGTQNLQVVMADVPSNTVTIAVESSP